jgi:hypothetical protein
MAPTRAIVAAAAIALSLVAGCQADNGPAATSASSTAATRSRQSSQPSKETPMSVNLVLDESVVPDQLKRRYTLDALRATLAALLEAAQAMPGRNVERDGLLFDRALLLDNLLIVTTSDHRTAFNVHLDSATGSTVTRIDIVGVG